MPKLPTFTYRKLIKILEQSGFQIDHTTGSHFIFYNKINKKRVTVPVKFFIESSFLRCYTILNEAEILS